MTSGGRSEPEGETQLAHALVCDAAAFDLTRKPESRTTLTEKGTMQPSRSAMIFAAALACVALVGCPNGGGGEDAGSGGDGGGGDDGGGDVVTMDTTADTADSTDGGDAVDAADTEPDPEDVGDGGTEDTDETDAVDTAGDGGTDGGRSVDIGPADANSPNLSQEDFLTRLREVVNANLCTAVVKCPEKQSTGLYTLLTRAGGTVQSCRQTLSGDFIDFASIIRSELESGLVTYNRERSGDCIDAIRIAQHERPCDSTITGGGIPEACAETLQGEQSDGDPCETNYQCQSGACDTTSNDEACYGSCVGSLQTQGEGDPCGADHQVCDASADLFCTTDAENPTCEKRESVASGESCKAPAQCEDLLGCVGGTCLDVTTVAQGESCSDPGSRCEPGLTCGPDGSCKSPAASGESCRTIFDCAFGNYCEGASPDSAGSCAARKSSGSSCETGFECASLTCDGGSCVGIGEDCQLPSSG